MKHKLITWLKVLVCLTLILYMEKSTGTPLDDEDLDSLLPKIPQDKNETMAAVVGDPVVKDAVQYAAANGSLNALVVKKKVFIMPASDPNKVLSSREQLLVVPTEHLEDVRKNITETKQGESDEYISIENHSLLENDIDEDAEKCENKSECKSYEIDSDSGSTKTTNDDLKGGDVFVEGTITQEAGLLEGDSEKVSIPIFAVVDPANLNDDKAESSIIAVLPNDIEDDDVVKTQTDFLRENDQKIQQEAQQYIDRTSLSIDPEKWKSLSAEIQTPKQSSVSVSLEYQVPPIVTEEVVLTPFMVPGLEIVGPVYQAPDNAENSRETDDMDVAEDIIFRPLFRYRQQEQQRSKYRDDGYNRRRSNYRPYNSYRNYDSYPRRDYYYKSRYNDYY